MSVSNVIVSALLGGAATFILAFVAGRTKQTPDHEGWLTLRPGWLLNSLFVCCLIVVGLMTLALVNLASRTDQQDQIISLVFMIFFFGICAVYIARTCYSRTFKWNDDFIVVRKAFGETASHPWGNVQGLKTNSLTGEHIIGFKTGEKFRIPVMMKGADQLVRQVQSRGAH